MYISSLKQHEVYLGAEVQVCYLFDKAFLDLLKVTIPSLCPEVKICKPERKNISMK